MKTIPTFVVALALFFLGFGAQASLAQGTAEKKVSLPSPAATTPLPTTNPATKIECTTPVISFLSLKKLTQPLEPKVRAKMVEEILVTIKKEPNRRVPNLKLINQGALLSLEYYEVSGDLSGRKLTVQHIPPVEGKNAGNISLNWDEKGEKSKSVENWFISLFLNGVVETAFDSKGKKTMTLSAKVPKGTKHKEFWQLQADQVINELHEKLKFIGSL